MCISKFITIALSTKLPGDCMERIDHISLGLQEGRGTQTNCTYYKLKYKRYKKNILALNLTGTGLTR